MAKRSLLSERSSYFLALIHVDCILVQNAAGLAGAQ